MLTDALWLVPWGLLAACAAILVVAAGGFFVGSRWLAGLCVAALGIFSTLIVLALTLSHSGFSVGQLPFLVPGVVSSIIGLWFTVTERRRAQSAGSAA